MGASRWRRRCASSWPDSRPPVALQILSNWRCREDFFPVARTGSLLLIVTFPPLTVCAAERSAKRACANSLYLLYGPNRLCQCVKALCGAPRYILETTCDGASFHLASHKMTGLTFISRCRIFFLLLLAAGRRVESVTSLASRCRSLKRSCCLQRQTTSISASVLFGSSSIIIISNRCNKDLEFSLQITCEFNCPHLAFHFLLFIGKYNSWFSQYFCTTLFFLLFPSVVPIKV